MSRGFFLEVDSYWLPVWHAARLCGRTHATVRRWVAAGQVETRIVDGEVRVWLWSVFEKDANTPRRRRLRGVA